MNGKKKKKPHTCQKVNINVELFYSEFIMKYYDYKYLNFQKLIPKSKKMQQFPKCQLSNISFLGQHRI